MQLTYTTPIVYKSKKNKPYTVTASYTDGTFIKYLHQHEFTKKILFRVWIKTKLLTNALRTVLFMFTCSPLTDTSKRTYLHVLSCNGSRSGLDLTYSQYYKSTYENIQNTLVHSMLTTGVISHLPTTYTYTPIVHERTSVSILYLNDNKYELFISPVGYFTFSKPIRVKSNRDLIYFPNLQLGEQDVLVFALQVENRVQEFKREYTSALTHSEKIAHDLFKQETSKQKHVLCNVLSKLESNLGSSEPVEPETELLVETVEEPAPELLVEPVEPVEITLDIHFKCKFNSLLTNLLYQSYHNKGAIYKLIVGKKIWIVSDLHHNYIPEQYKHFGVRLSDETSTSYTYHFYVDENQILYYTSVLRVYD